MFALHRKQNRLTGSSPLGKRWKVVTATCVALCVGAIGYVANQAKSVQKVEAARIPTESFDVGMKMGRHKIQLGTDTATTYRAGKASVHDGNAQPDDEVAPPQIGALQSGQAQPLSMSNEDFDGDGMQDLVIGYAGGIGGLVTLRRGNLEAIAPKAPEALEGLRHGRYPTPFMDEVDTYDLPEAPAFLATGDFNADGYQDVIAAANFGQRLYLLSGDGHGGLHQAEQFSVPGYVTAMTKGRFNRGAGFTTLVIGIVDQRERSSALVYDETGRGVLGAPESFALPAQATSAVLTELDGDISGDLVIGAGNHVVIVHGRNPALQNSQNLIEGFETTVPVRAVSAGYFLFDREGKTKIAWLSDDGNVHLMTAGSLDRRPFTRDEVELIRRTRFDIERERADEASFTALMQSLVDRPALGDDWQEAETRNIGAIPGGANPQSLLTPAHWSGLLFDDLMVLDSAKVQILQNTKDAQGMKAAGSQTMAASDSVEVDSAPVAVAMMRLSVDGRPSMVVLGKNQIDATPIISIAATFVVNKTTDTADSAPGNGTCSDGGAAPNCSLRAAIMESNALGGSNVITLAASTTYTINKNGQISGADDEFDAGGADDTGGDLDIEDWNSICVPASACPGLTLGHPALTSVTINGGDTNTTIIQMGTFSQTTPGCVNKDRVLQSNDGSNPQFPTNVTLTNLTIQGGSAPHWNTNAGCAVGGPFFHETGGGIKFDGSKSSAPGAGSSATLTLTGVKITGNTGDGQGGGVFINSGSGNISGSIFTLNTSTLGSGGGLSWNGGNVPNTASLTIGSTTFGGSGLANTAIDNAFGSGGGINTNGGTAFTLNNASVISFNTAANQGGGLNFAGSAVISVANSTVSSNTAKDDGGGVYVNARLSTASAPADASTSALTGATITSNTADSDLSGAGDGGGVFNNEGTMTITSTTHIDGNHAINGGGIFTEWTGNVNDPPASLSMTGGTIGQAGGGNGNTAKNNGGGIAIDLSNHANSATTPKTGTVTLTNVTITNNTANSDSSGGGDGGGIYQNSNDANFRVSSTIDGVTVDSNVANSGTGSGIFLASGTMTGANTLSLNGGNSLSMTGGTFVSTPGAFNLTGNFTHSGGVFTHNNGTVNCNGSTGAQTIGGTTPNTFFNLIINNGSGVNLGQSQTVAGQLTLTNGVLGVGTSTLTLNGAVVFTSGSISSSAAGTVNYNQGSGGQNVAPGSYGNLTFSNFAKVLPATSIGVAGIFTPGTGVGHTITGNTIDFNGSGAQTIPAFLYNNLTSSNVGARTLASTGTIGIAGIFTPGSNAYTIAGSTIDFNGSGAQTIPAFNYNNLTSSNVGARTLASTGTVGVAGTFTPGANAYTIAGSTIDFNGAGAQTIPAFLYNNLTSSNVGARTLASSGTIGVAGTFTPGANAYTINGSTIDFNGSGAQTIPAFNYNNLTSSNVGARTLASSGTVGIAGTFTPGTNTYTINGSTINFNGSGAQTIPAFLYNNLTSSNVGARTLASSGTIGVAGTFTPGTNTYTINGSTIDFNGSGGQTIPAFLYNNLTSSNSGARTLASSGTIGVAATFTPGANVYTITGSTIDFNGSGAQTIPAFNYNNLTSSNVGARTLASSGTVGVAGTLTPGTNTYTITGSTIDFNGSGGQTIPAFLYNNLTSSNVGARTLASSGTIGVAGVFTPGANAYTITGSTINFNGAGSQGIPGFTYNNLTSSGGAAARTLDAVNTIKIAGAFTPGTNVYTITGSTIEYNGAALQILPSSGFNTYNNLTINNTVGATGFAGLTVNGLLEVAKGTFTSSSTYNNVQVDNTGTLAGTAATTINVIGNWTINTGGAFTPNNNTVNFNGSGAQTIGGTATTAGATTFFNLIIANAGSGVTLGQNETVNGTLTLTNDLTTSTFTLTQPSSAPASAGTGDVVGNVKRTNAPTPLPNGALTYGNPNNTIGFTAGVNPTDITIKLTKTAPTDASTGQTNSGFPGAILRTYVITPSTNVGFTANMQLHYNAGDLNGNTAGTLKLWKFITTPTRGWQQQPASVDNGAGVGVSLSGIITGFSPWTMSNVSPTAADGNVSGQILDNSGNPVEGAAVRMSGTQNRLTVTDAQGSYHFDNVETNGLYTVVPTRSNYTFSPSQRAFSQLGQHTDAAFSASLTNAGLNPLDATEYFVRQQYRDFLGREPDESGFSFWVNGIERCGLDQNCRAQARINTSAAFFLSIEFQQTGYLVYRTYQAAFGDIPNEPVPIRLNEFRPDTAEISNGVIVLQSGWQQKLDSNKQAYAAEFVQRPRFVAAYPTTMTPAEFVNQLFANASVTPTASDRTDAINEFGTAVTTSDVAARGRALRRVAENSTLAQQEFNQAFVLMQYFGYLQRDANTGPDIDFTGYNFWLNKLNTFGGNFQNAEMVNSFLVSSEYRGRFPR